ncbi:hypothetical protein [Halovenus sp. HT40]|uniref:hypothetical protein n=1 Tax=Halovenus sp. HT40 TaxID=3126691 RepID=UPI00300E7CE4
MTTDGPELPVPETMLDEKGFALAERRTETLFELAAVRIEGITRRHEDDHSREALRDATGGAIDHPVRFLAVTQLQFKPALPPGVSLSMFASTIRSEARSSFESQLEDRGLTNVERGSSNRLRLDGGSRVRVREFTAEDPLPDADGHSLELEFRLAVLTHRGTALVVTAGFPVAALADQFDLPNPPAPLTRTAEEYDSAFTDLLDGIYAELTD